MTAAKGTAPTVRPYRGPVEDELAPKAEVASASPKELVATLADLVRMLGMIAEAVAARVGGMYGETADPVMMAIAARKCGPGERKAPK